VTRDVQIDVGTQREFERGLSFFEEIRSAPRVRNWLQQMKLHDIQLLQHSLLVGAIASLFTCSVRLSPAEKHLFVTGALLHDVGKVSISRQILQKCGPLTPNERRQLERHPELGQKLLCDDGWESEILELVHLHHERLDGSGYPNGLSAEGIGKLVRMVTLCDIFSALIEDRSYRPSPPKPLDIMEVMTSELDVTLFKVFSRKVPQLAYMAQKILKLEMSDASFAN
jgi:HD-GYP domain-containing protein (c-di-GMP phosphodiesterase class II)